MKEKVLRKFDYYGYTVEERESGVYLIIGNPVNAELKRKHSYEEEVERLKKFIDKELD